MTIFYYCGLKLFWCLLFGVWCLSSSGAAPQPPPDWRIELVAEAPAIRHPSVVCSAPDGRVFVAEDPMDISAPADAMQGRIICFHSDGRRTVFADKLHAVFGMQYLEGKVYVLHNPKFSVFTDESGVGKNRLDLIESTHPNPWALDWNDHVPANFRLAMDGYFYVAVGDKGIYGAIGRDGKRLDLHGGGIVRLRPDGTGLEVYATGVRNILDVALNAEDDLFTYDNTDEHDWMGRLTHMIDGGFYGYPYDFVPRQPYTLWMMHDFGAGAACGVVCYTEDALPPTYQGNLFLADFGKRQVIRVRIERAGATYRVASHEEFFKDPPGDFRPVGIALSADGLSLYICDWQHRDTKENVSVGRLWKATYTGKTQTAPKPAWYVPAATGNTVQVAPTELIKALSHPSKQVRLTAQRRLAGQAKTPQVESQLIALLNNRTAPLHARSHAIWTLDAVSHGQAGRAAIVAAAKDEEPSVQRQALRLIGARQMTEGVDVLIHALQASPDVMIRAEAATALGRVGDGRAISTLLGKLDESHLFARYAAFAALNRIGRRHPAAWAEIAKGLGSRNERVAEATTFALRETYDEALVEALHAIVTERANMLATSSQQPGASLNPRETALKLLTSLALKSPDWKGEWWAYHPALAAAPKKTLEWAGTARVLNLLRVLLDDREPSLRLSAAEGLRAVGNKEAAPQLRRRFERETVSTVRRAILAALGEFQDSAFAPVLGTVLRDSAADRDTRIAAVRAGSRIGGAIVTDALLAMLASADELIRVEVVQALAQLKESRAFPLLQPLLTNAFRPLRLAAQRAVSQINAEKALPALRPLLKNSSAAIRSEAVTVIGSLRSRSAVPDLLAAWRAAETKEEAIESLVLVSDVRALDAYVEGLASAKPSLRDQCRKALIPIRDEALPLLEARAQGLKPEVIAELRRVYEKHPRLKESPLFESAAPVLEPGDYEKFALAHTGDAARGERIFSDESGVACIKCHAIAGRGVAIGPDLTLVGAQFPRAELIEHILQPSKVVREGNQQFMIGTRDGETHAGIIKSETPDTLTILNTAGQSQAIPKKEVISREASKLSLMPEGLHVGLTLEQFADLIAYLESCKVDPRKAATEPGGFIP